MKTAPSIVTLIAAAILASCSSTRHLSLAELETRLQEDTRKQHENGGRPWYQWSYLGSDHERHYFRRQVGRMMYSGSRDGVYAIPRESLELRAEEFMRPQPDDSTRWREAFTKHDAHGMPAAYSTDFGIATGR
jgi:hypothetical protein